MDNSRDDYDGFGPRPRRGEYNFIGTSVEYCYGPWSKPLERANSSSPSSEDWVMGVAMNPEEEVNRL